MDAPLAGIYADNNGTTDLISIIFGGSRLDYFSLYRSNGNGTFEAREGIANRFDASALALGMGAPVNMVVGDFDGDDDLDLVMTSTRDFILLLEKDGTGVFTESGRVTVGLRLIHVRLADFDSDGSLDILAANADSRTIVVAFGDGSGSFGGPAGGDSAWRLRPRSEHQAV